MAADRAALRSRPGRRPAQNPASRRLCRPAAPPPLSTTPPDRCDRSLERAKTSASDCARGAQQRHRLGLRHQQTRHAFEIGGIAIQPGLRDQAEVAARLDRLSRSRASYCCRRASASSQLLAQRLRLGLHPPDRLIEFPEADRQIRRHLADQADACGDNRCSARCPQRNSTRVSRAAPLDFDDLDQAHFAGARHVRAATGRPIEAFESPRCGWPCRLWAACAAATLAVLHRHKARDHAAGSQTRSSWPESSARSICAGVKCRRVQIDRQRAVVRIGIEMKRDRLGVRRLNERLRQNMLAGVLLHQIKAARCRPPRQSRRSALSGAARTCSTSPSASRV